MQVHRQISESNTPSEGNGITGIPSAVFFNEMGNKKKKKMGIKKKKTFTQIVAGGRFLIKKNVDPYNDCTSNVSDCLRIKVAQSNSLSAGKEITGMLSRPIGISQYLEVFT